MSCLDTEAEISVHLCAVGGYTGERPCIPPEARTICSFYLEGRCRFGENCHNVHPPGVELPKITVPQKQKATREVNNEPQEGDEKKPSLKTAGDVRKRIQWDPNLQKEHFTVGYLDRFSGVVEKPFTSFTWEHLATVDLDQLAVPQHRIQFYKYKNVKVWDKNERLDHVFGSAGGNTTIIEVIQRVEEELEKKRTSCASDDDSDDDDDLVVVATDVASGKGLVSMISERQSQTEDQLRATHFFCIRVDSEEVRREVASVQEQVVREDPTLRSCTMPGELLHVTLAMLKLDSFQAIHEAGNLLQELKENLKAVFDSPLESGGIASSRFMRAKGLCSFGARVLYSKLEVPDSFTSSVDLLRGGIRKIKDASITSHFDFVPHMTLLKVNRVTARERRSKYINSCLYSDYLDHDFGVMPVNNISLCIINDLRGPDGFYLTCEDIKF
ncbi:Leukocyte receptor cluster member 9 [Chionoecetes opilio]|uniref:Leukocyte receptor cluster member 9 n=1 Tax=Chionoecetes opilio TaxID=41210 RepID=A0A8J5BV77_CHIOP|nr:Leukocyte receptor cluster member 9 [Chionoecetes opilio]